MGSGVSPRGKFRAIDQSDYQKHGAPPHIGVQAEQDYIRIYRRIYRLVDSHGTNQRAVNGQRNTNKKPDRNHALHLALRNLPPPENYAQYEKPTINHPRPEKQY